MQPPISAWPGIDVAKLGDYLASAVDGYDQLAGLTVERLPGGRSNLTYLLTQAHQQWVLRRPPLGHVMPSGHDMAREFRMLSFLSEHIFPAPQPIALCEDESVLGVVFQVLRYVPGLVISGPDKVRSLSGAEIDHLCHELIRVLAQLHELPVPGMPPGRSASSADYLRRQLTRWTQQWQHTKTRELPAFEQLTQWLSAAVNDVPKDLQVTIVHGDYRLENLVVDPASKDISAVLDWEMSTQGDPLMDLALLLVYWEQPGEPLRQRVALAPDLTTASDFWSRDRLIEEYADIAALRIDRRHLSTCVALACLKLAVVMESIHYRYLAGQTVDELSAGMAAAAPALLEMGVRISRGAGMDDFAR